MNSWRWQAHDGGWSFASKKTKIPGQGTIIERDVSILVFHGNPKPHEIHDAVVRKFWY